MLPELSGKGQMAGGGAEASSRGPLCLSLAGNFIHSANSDQAASARWRTRFSVQDTEDTAVEMSLSSRR